MPWREVSIVEDRRELCRRFEIHPDTGYKWLQRRLAGDEALGDRSRRPHSSPLRCSDDLEASVLLVRDSHPAWGARKIARCLERDGIEPPSVSTVHEILRRHGRVSSPASPGKAYERFEKDAPNRLWQMDFKGWVRLGDGTCCHPLTIVDDHSRFVPCLKACDNQQNLTVRGHLTTTFRRYGLPDAFFVDNGKPWGDSGGSRWTRLR